MNSAKSQTRATAKVRARVELQPKVDKQLAAYAAAAGAAGVALFAAAPPAAAKVVYTSANISIAPRSSYALDLNHDGIADFTLLRCVCTSSHFSSLFLDLDVHGNAVRFPGGDPGEAAALNYGAAIGPSQKFTSSTQGKGGEFMALAFGYNSIVSQNGPWAHATKKYLGLKFMISGKVHYGWALLTVDYASSVTLLGYAYETTANTKILAGHKSDDSSEAAAAGPKLPMTPPVSLGWLARGAYALNVWRRDL